MLRHDFNVFFDIWSTEILDTCHQKSKARISYQLKWTFFWLISMYLHEKNLKCFIKFFIFNNQMQQNMNLISWLNRMKRFIKNTTISIIKQHKEVFLIIDNCSQTKRKIVWRHLSNWKTIAKLTTFRDIIITRKNSLSFAIFINKEF